MEMKKGFTIVLLLVLVIITGCNEKGTTTIGFLYPSKETDRFNKESNYFKQYCADKGVEVIIKTASNDESKQIDQCNELIELGVDALVIIAANVNTAAVMVRNAQAESIPVMAYNRMIKNCEVDFFVASNNDLIGKVMVDAVVKEKPTGNYVILGGDKFDKNGEDLQTALLKYLKPKVDSKDVNLVYSTFIEKWNPTIAAFEMEKVLSLHGHDIDAVVAAYDGMSSAVIEVLKKHGIEDNVVVTGQDAELEACKNVINGDQLMTVFHPLKTIAEKGAEIAIEMTKGSKLKDFVNSSEYNGTIDVPTNRVNSIAVTKDNIDEVLINSGFYTKQELYN
ncbi:substrate-binding domain-containing protein [Labilibacter marinus]|uniref:substrate-binding domain-containing protein n=1 Tax=Labilibacter marinus TaxID=1477105 RepID=UPI0009F89B12|nr:substrate-binding domain-containing protein [Labilibacter marinus]